MFNLMYSTKTNKYNSTINKIFMLYIELLHFFYYLLQSLTMKSFAIIGDYESVVIYKTFGWDVFYVNLADENNVLTTFEKVIKNPVYKKIFVVEEVYEMLLTKNIEIEKLAVNIIPLPGINGPKNQAKKKYSKLAAIATGMKLE